MVAGESDNRLPAADSPRFGDCHQQRHIFQLAHFSYIPKSESIFRLIIKIRSRL